MSKLQHFLEQLSDWELANFYNYRYGQFIKQSQQKIDAEIEKRGIDTGSVEMEYNEKALLCPRCFSDKYYDSTEMETITYHYATVDFEVDVRTCLVCLYSSRSEHANSKTEHVSALGFISRLINRKK